MRRPVVYLIGAGPGDPGLLTMRGSECIAAADVVIYDHLASPKLLRSARDDAELIYVGRPGAMSPGEVTALVVERARAGGGAVVARVKSGDPCVFGASGEEALVLAEAGIPFEIVPGVSAGCATPAYAGIPVTQCGVAEAVTFATDGAEWDRFAALPGTICVFVRDAELADVTGALREAGRAPETPTAVISRGTTPHQRTVLGELGDINARAAEAGIAPPALLVVGEVVRLREKLAWFEDRPLFGKSVVVTRARTQSAGLIASLERLGAEVIEFPTIRMVEPESYAPVDEAIRNLDIYDWLVLSSVNGVHGFFDRLPGADKDGRHLAGLRVAAVGPATADACRARGIRPDLVPDEYRAEGLLDGLCERGVGAGSRVLIARALEAREILPEQLRERGARADVVPVYRTVPGSPDPLSVERLSEGAVDVITFTSASTVRNFVALTEGMDRDALYESATIASIGPITSDAVRAFGLTVDIEPAEYTVPALVEAIGEYFSRT